MKAGGQTARRKGCICTQHFTCTQRHLRHALHGWEGVLDDEHHLFTCAFGIPLCASCSCGPKRKEGGKGGERGPSGWGPEDGTRSQISGFSGCFPQIRDRMQTVCLQKATSEPRS